MKRSFLLILILIPVPFSLCAQTMKMIPDSGYQGEQLPVTIVGIGTQFSSSGNVSEIIVKLERSGTIYDQSDGRLANDSTIDVTFALGATMLGSYDLEADVINGGSEQTFNQDSAFTVLIASPSILSVTPSSAHDSQSVGLQIVGLNTNFESGTTPTILFQQNGQTYFTSQMDTVHSATSIGASVTIPPASVAPEGVYDIIVQYGTYSDTGKQKFTVLGPAPPAPGITLSPDSGVAGTQFNVTIVGQGTNFDPSGNVSSYYPASIDLSQNGTTLYHTTTTDVPSSTLAYAVFNLPASLSSGAYDAKVYYSGTSYDWQTNFFVLSAKPDTSYFTVPNSVQLGSDLFSVTTSQRALNPSCYPTGTYLEKGSDQITGTITHAVFPDTILASFIIPDTVDTGLYTLYFVLTCDSECCNLDSVPSAIRIIATPEAVKEVSSPNVLGALFVFPNPTSNDVDIGFTVSSPTPVHLLVYDALGRTVATLCDRTLGAGLQSFEWASDDAPDGGYFYEIIAGDERYGGRIVVQH